MLKPVKLFLILAFISTLASLQGKAVAYDFSPSRNRVTSDLRQTGTPNPKIAIIFKEENNDLKYRTNLVKLKSQFSASIAQSLTVADPVIVGEIVSKNELSTDEILNDPNIFDQFRNRTESTHILLISLSADASSLAVVHTLVNGQNQLVDNFPLSYPLEPLENYAASVGAGGAALANGANTGLAPDAGVPAGNANLGAQRQGLAGSGYAQRNEGFNLSGGASASSSANQGNNSSAPASGYTQQNTGGGGFGGLAGIFPLGTYNHMTYDSWGYFHPTAIVNPRIHYLELRLWGKDWEGVDLPMQSARYSLTYQRLELAVFGTASEIKEYKTKSSYAHIKFNLIDALSFSYPFFLSIGGKKNVFWDKDNPDLYYQGDEDVLERNEKLNDTSLFVAMSLGIEALGLMTHIYYDNVYFSANANLILHSIVRIYAETERMHIRTDHKDNDYSYGIELNDPRSQGFAFYLSRQNNLDKVLIGFKLSLL